MLFATESSSNRSRNNGWLRSVLWALGLALILSPVGVSQDAAPPGYRAYPIRNRTAEDLAPQVRKMLSGLGSESRVLVDQELNRLVVQGSAEAHQLAAQVVGALDQPAADRNADSKPTAVARGYRTPGQDPREVASALRKQFPGTKIEADARTGQVIVLAPLSMQTKITAALRAEQPLKQQAKPANLPQQGLGHQLRHVEWREFEQRLSQL